MFKDLVINIEDGQKMKTIDKILKKKTDVETRGTDDFGEGLSERSEICEENYGNLEKLLQKYEAEIRNHIRIEQHLKIYTESLQEKFDEKEKNFKKSIHASTANEKVSFILRPFNGPGCHFLSNF